MWQPRHYRDLQNQERWQSFTIVHQEDIQNDLKQALKAI